MISTEQERAKNAWKVANDKENRNKEFKNLAKGAPALIMSNGLMPSLAFWQSKKAYQPLVNALLGWLKERKLVKNIDFYDAMQDLQSSDSDNYMRVTEETLEYLKWLRNFVGAVVKDDSIKEQ